MIREFIPAKYRKPVQLARLNYDDEGRARAPQLIHSSLKPVVIGPLADPVFVHLRQNYPSRAHFVRWEDFCETWNFRIQSGRMSLVVGDTFVPVKSVYVRSCEITPEYKHRDDLMIFMRLLSTLDQRRLGTMDLGISNFSKFLQLKGVIREAAFDLRSVAVPKTVLVKSGCVTGAQLARRMGPSVAKSVSCVRTQVFDDRAYRRFSRHRPAHAPVLIQKKKTGIEIRVHVVDGRVFPLGIHKNSDRVDYRYDCDVDLIHDIDLTSEEFLFCQRVQVLDGNPLIGLDLIRHEDGKTYCFEANPNPGWACFDYLPRVKAEISEAVLGYLEGK